MALRTYCLLSLLGISATAISQDDIIIKRDGSELNAKIIQVDNNRVTYKELDSKQAPEYYLESKDVYMIHYEKRGNVYFSPFGQRRTGEQRKRDKNADLIYLVYGKEIEAYNLQIIDNFVVYQEKKGKSSLLKDAPLVQAKDLKTSDIFLIKYKDGTKEIFTPLAAPVEESAQDEESVNEEEANSQAEQLQVIFYDTKTGETLSEIADRYSVTVAEIKQWNDLSTSVKATSKLKRGMRLMLYVKNTKN